MPSFLSSDDATVQSCLYVSCASSRIAIVIAIAVIYTEFRYFACFRMRMKVSARHVILNQPVFCVSATAEAGHGAGSESFC